MAAEGMGGASAGVAPASRWRTAARLLLAAGTGFALSMIAWAMPPGTDQSLFFDYAGELLAGQVLYLDVWDNKQPGVFWLYAAFRSLFGGDWQAVMRGYSLWMAVSAGLLAAIAMRAAPGSRAWLLAPFLTVGIASLRAHPGMVAQVEQWVVLPLSAILLLAVPGRPGAQGLVWRHLAIGASSCIVALLKLVLVPVAAAMLATVLALRVRSGELRLAQAGAAIAWSALGFAAACLPVVLHFADRGALAEFLWTTFVYPREALAATERAPVSRLLASLLWVAKGGVWYLPALALALHCAWRRPASRLTLVVAASLAWAGAGLVMILTQKFSWWTYQMSLLVWPLGLLAALGCVAAPRARGGRDGRRPAAALATGLSLAGLAVFAILLGWKATQRSDWPQESVAVGSRDTAVRVAASARLRCGTVYALGDPVGVQSLTGLRQALPTHGIFWRAFLPEQARRLPDELAAARPDLVYVDRENREYLLRVHPGIVERFDRWLGEHYRVVAVDALDSTWWERIDAEPEPPCPARGRFVIPRS